MNLAWLGRRLWSRVVIREEVNIVCCVVVCWRWDSATCTHVTHVSHDGVAASSCHWWTRQCHGGRGSRLPCQPDATPPSCHCEHFDQDTRSRPGDCTGQITGRLPVAFGSGRMCGIRFLCVRILLWCQLRECRLNLQVVLTTVRLWQLLQDTSRLFALVFLRQQPLIELQ